jgi:hypothetical protein
MYWYFQIENKTEDVTERKTQTRHGNIQVYRLVKDGGSYSIVKIAVIGLYF